MAQINPRLELPNTAHATPASLFTLRFFLLVLCNSATSRSIRITRTLFYGSVGTHLQDLDDSINLHEFTTCTRFTVLGSGKENLICQVALSPSPSLVCKAQWRLDFAHKPPPTRTNQLSRVQTQERKRIEARPERVPGYPVGALFGAPTTDCTEDLILLD